MKRLTLLLTTLCLIAFGSATACASESIDYKINLSNNVITVNGEPISGNTSSTVYMSKVTETHSEVKESLKGVENTVVNITDGGIYSITGSIDDGQIYINAGDDDLVTLILNNATVSCRTAPAILVKNAYDPKKAGDAGVTITLADNSINNLSGSSSEDNDAALSTNVSIIMDGNGTLNIVSDNEGIETNQHFTLNSGNLIINSADDAINGSEDGVSHLMFNGGFVYACASEGVEGDGIDSNGYVTINGGTVIALAHPTSQDGALDADLGVIVNGGTVVGVGNMQSELSSNSQQQYIQLIFSSRQAKDTSVTITDEKGTAVAAFKSPQTFTSIAFSSPDLKDGTYYAYTQGNIVGDASNGLYSNITSFQNGVQQQHSGNSTGMSEGMFRPDGGSRPEGMQPPTGQTGERPEGMQPPTRQQDEWPEGIQPPTGQQGEWPEGMTRPDRLTESMESESAVNSVEFTVSGTANTFRVVKDATSFEASVEVSIEAPEETPIQVPPNNNPIKILLNNEYLSFDVAPTIENGRTLVPLRAIFEALNMNVEFDNGVIFAEKEGLIIETTVGGNVAYKNGEEITLDVGSKIVDGRTLVPVRFIAESVGLSVEYDEATKTVIIN